MRRWPEKHIPYFVVLEGVTSSQGCFFCSLEQSVVEKYFEELLYEHVNDPGIRKALRASAVYCSKHAQQLLRRGDSFGTSILYADQMRGFLEVFDGLTKASMKSRAKAARIWIEHDGCPACAAQKDARQRYIEVFIEWFHEEEMQNSFRDSNGLVCLSHFLAVLGAFTDRHQADLFREITKTKCMELLTQMQEFQRKANWMHCREEVGKERDSWIRAVEFFAGGKGVFE